MEEPMPKKIRQNSQDRNMMKLEKRIKKLEEQVKGNRADIDKNGRAIRAIQDRITKQTKRLDDVGSISTSNRKQLKHQQSEVNDVVSAVENILQAKLADEQHQEARRVLTRARKRQTQITNEIQFRKEWGR
jgi:chromosome segregation ATPase